MTDVNGVEKLSLNKQLVVAVVELIDFYSKKGVFKVNEFKDIATINERLTEVAIALEANKEYTELTAQELGFVLLIFKEGTTRIPTAIESFGQLFGIFQHYKTLLEQAVAKDEEAKKEIPRVEELA
jgi:hypothetical protein